MQRASRHSWLRLFHALTTAKASKRGSQPQERKRKGTAFRVSSVTTVPPVGLGPPLPCSGPQTLLSRANQPSHTVSVPFGSFHVSISNQTCSQVAPFMVVVCAGVESGRTPLLTLAGLSATHKLHSGLAWPLCISLHGCTLLNGMGALADIMMSGLYGLSYLPATITGCRLPRRARCYGITAVPRGGFAPLLLIRTPIV